MRPQFAGTIDIPKMLRYCGFLDMEYITDLIDCSPQSVPLHIRAQFNITTPIGIEHNIVFDFIHAC
jgi:hypothetical protein